MNAFYIVMDKIGNWRFEIASHKLIQQEFYITKEGTELVLHANVWAKDKEEAIQIADDHRYWLINCNGWEEGDSCLY
jgi:hypothetical protein